MSQDAIMAGVDTTGTTAAFLLLDLAKNPDKQETLFQEIKTNIGDGPTSESQLNKMKESGIAVFGHEYCLAN